jgi:uncharacterized protein YecE (DUF72 family)
MDFGRVPDPTRVDFTLPPEAAITGRTLAGGADGTGWLDVGAPMWARADWIGSFYPAGTAQSRLLQAYGALCTCVELNATFYSVPEAKTLASWAADTPEGFLFVPKLHREISHDRPLADSAPAARAFMERLALLGPRLGPCFLQLPPRIGPGDLPALAALFDAIPDARVHVEFRHPAFFVAPGVLREDLVTGLVNRRLGAVITDAAGRRDVCHATLTVPEVVIRFVGNGPAHLELDQRRLDAWFERLVDWRARGLQRAFLFVHQPDDVELPGLLSYALRRAREHGHARTPAKQGQLGLF